MDQFTCEKNKSTKKYFLNVTVTTVLTQVMKGAYTAQKMKSSIKDFFRKCDKIRSFLRIWSHLQKKSLANGNLHFLCSDILDTTSYDWPD